MTIDGPSIVVTAAADEPVSVALAREHLRITNNDEDSYIRSLVRAATQEAESYTARAFMTQTRKQVLDCFPGCPIAVRYPPLQSVSSVKYTDSNDVLQTVSSSIYTVDTYREPALIFEALDQDWPTDEKDVPNAVEINYVAGYADADSVPEAIRQAILLRVSDFYENRESVVVGQGFTAVQTPRSWEHLLAPYRIFQ